MDTLTPSQILLSHGIEVNPADPRRTEQILQDYILLGAIVLPKEIEQPTPESTL